jgi:catechol 2,3-dioxygenase-like lactoylglutathione lyase family enzyme
LLRNLLSTVLFVGCASMVLIGQPNPRRPPITGISHVTVYAADPDASRRFYVGKLGLLEGTPDSAGNARYFVSAKQYVVVAPLPSNHNNSRFKAVAYTTTNAATLRRYLAAHSVRVPNDVTHNPDGSLSFEVNDPEGYIVGFEQPPNRSLSANPNNPTSTRIIHVGYAVRNRAAEDRFYRDILGFRLYWHGGMKDGVEEFVSQQVPDGTDWLEYMLTVPAKPSQQTLGVLNHFSLGVSDINDAARKLEAHGWHETKGEHRQDGRDGKRQLNVFDPDLTRVEFMEFKPFTTPCCAPFTGQHPQP